MKSTTLRRANLSKEKIQTLESLAKYRRQTQNLNVLYVQPQQKTKERELDMLWNNFKQSSKQDKSPTVYLITGFVAGVIVMLIITTLINFSTKGVNESTNSDIANVANTRIEDNAITFIPADKDVTGPKVASTSKDETYTVQSGDTIESIIIRFYGSYSKKHEDAIKEANSMSNPNALSIGQKLIIPLN